MRSLYTGKSVHQCFQLIYFFLYHTGYLGFKLENGTRLYYTQWSCVYVYIIRFMLLAGFYGGFTLKFTDEESYNAMIGHLSPVVKFILCFECSLTTLTYLEVSFLLDHSRKKHLEYALQLQHLDEELKRDFPSVNWNYAKSSRKYNPMTASIYTFFTIISFSYVFNMAHCRCDYFSSFIISFSYACLTGSPGLATFLFIAGMDMTRLRFRLLRKLIKLHFLARGDNERSNLKDLRKLKILQHYFKEYSYMIPRINEVLGNVSATGMFCDFAIITNLGFLICSKAIEAKSRWYEYVFIALFMSPRIYKLIITNIYGFLTEKEKRNCSLEFVRMENNFSKPLIIRGTLQSFLHWRMHNNYYFVVGKALRCNLVLLFMILNSIINYIIILIQLQYQQNVITNNLKNDLSKEVELIKR